LSHLISPKGVTPDLDKVATIQNWPQPRSLTDLRRFLGLTGFYKIFIRYYATLAAPLNNLLHEQKFTWLTSTHQAFTTFKIQISNVPTLCFLDFTQPFVAKIDASVVVVGAVLSQQDHPFSFFSKKMCPRLQASSVYVREMYAITEADKKWRQYLLRNHFKIFTDKKKSQHTPHPNNSNTRTTKMDNKIIGIRLSKFIRTCKQNLVVDALSLQVAATP